MIGDRADFHARLKRLMPRWFGQDQGETPVLDALLLGPATVLEGVYGFIQYAKAQTRVATATGGWLDLIASDFFGATLGRKRGQSDASFRSAIIANLLRPKATRQALSDAVEAVTGVAPRIFEPLRPADTGGWNDPQNLAFGMAGGWGSMDMPYQVFLDAKRAQPAGVANIAGYGDPQGALNTGSDTQWVDGSAPPTADVDAEIYAAIERVRPVGVTVWVNIT